MQVLTQEKAAIKIQAGVRGLLTRRQVHRTAQEELQFIGMQTKVCRLRHLPCAAVGLTGLCPGTVLLQRRHTSVSTRRIHLTVT